MKHWSRNDKFAFVGVILATIGVASALFGQEIRRGLGLEPNSSMSQASVGGSAYAPVSSQAPGTAAHPPPLPPAGTAVPVMTIEITGDGDTITLDPTNIVSAEPDATVSGDGSSNTFTLGPKQTARIELKGDSNTVHVAAKLKDRVTIVNNGDGNKVTD